jgi:glycosyltransferase involved in cell wall biosynthesis
MRIAFFSPLPPAPTGIADYSIDVLREIAPHHAITVFHDQPSVDRDRLPPSVEARPVTEYGTRAYDLTIYQIGNGAAHQYIYPFLPRSSGLVVLHDLVLHHARAQAFLDSAEARAYAAEPADPARRTAAEARIDEYRRELEYEYPGRGTAIAAAQLGTSGVLLPYAYPFFRLPVETARLVACHNDFMAAAVRTEVPDTEVVRIPMMMVSEKVTPETVRSLRSRLGIADGEFVVGSFGLLTREKRIASVARAVAQAALRQPKLRLLLVGPVADRPAIDRLLDDCGVAGRAIVTDLVPYAELAAHIEAADLVAHLRYPTARETSAALLRVLAQGRPTIASDLEHLADIPDEAIARIPLDGEERALTQAIERLAQDGDERRRLGRQAAAFVADAHSPARCRTGYLDAIEQAARRPAAVARAAWPAHWRADGGTPLA